MNLPNRLTTLRIIFVPVVTALLLAAPAGGWLMWLLAGLTFGAAAVTDAFDGAIARKRGLVTDFGKLMDPVADKLLVTAALACFVSMGLCSAWVLIIVLAREFLVTSIRMVSASRGLVIAANNWGKVKTVTQIIAIVAIIVAEFALDVLEALGIMPAKLLLDGVRWGEQGLLWLAALMTVISGVTYIIGAKKLFNDI